MEAAEAKPIQGNFHLIRVTHSIENGMEGRRVAVASVVVVSLPLAPVKKMDWFSLPSKHLVSNLKLFPNSLHFS